MLHLHLNEFLFSWLNNKEMIFQPTVQQSFSLKRVFTVKETFESKDHMWFLVLSMQKSTRLIGQNVACMNKCALLRSSNAKRKKELWKKNWWSLIVIHYVDMTPICGSSPKFGKKKMWITQLSQMSLH